MVNDTLAEDLRQAIGALVRVVRVADAMSPGHAAILGYLDRDGPQTIAELAHRRTVTHQSAAKSVKELLDVGLVRAEPHPVDRRKRLLYITDDGVTRLSQERALRASSLGDAICGALTVGEQERIRDCIPLLDRLTVYLSAHGGDHPGVLAQGAVAVAGDDHRGVGGGGLQNQQVRIVEDRKP